MPLFILWQRDPGLYIVAGSAFGWGLFGIGLRAVGVADTAASVVAALGGGLTTIGFDWRYRAKHEMGPFDIRASTVFSVPAWVWGIAMLLMMRSM